MIQPHSIPFCRFFLNIQHQLSHKYWSLDYQYPNKFWTFHHNQNMEQQSQIMYHHHMQYNSRNLLHLWQFVFDMFLHIVHTVLCQFLFLHMGRLSLRRILRYKLCHLWSHRLNVCRRSQQSWNPGRRFGFHYKF